MYALLLGDKLDFYMIKGVCDLSCIPLRKEPDSRSEILSQLLFGDTFEVLSQTEDGWTHIKNDYDQYEGWISSKQYAAYHASVSGFITNTVYPYLTLKSSRGNHLVPAGCSIPPSAKFQLGETTFENSTDIPAKTFAEIEQVALQYLNAPYLWGGRSPFGIDCSGFTQSVFKQCGIALRRDAWQQAEQGESVAFTAEVTCGDLAFFDNEEGRITHVGIMLAPGKIIHASGRVRIDELDHYGIINQTEKQYTHKLRLIKRMV